MSLAITRADVKAWFDTGDVPTAAQFKSLIDAFGMKYTETITLVADTDYTVTHGNAENALIVQVVDSNGVNVDIYWERDSSDPTNKVIINSSKAYASAEVTILT